MAILWLVLGLCLTAEVFAMPDKATLWLGPHVAPTGAHSKPKEHSPRGSPSPKGHGPSPGPKAHSHSPPPKAHSPSSSHSPIEKQARAFFVFGDSLVDNGNNNYLYTIARADMQPYGIDTPDHRPTGRFSNGLNIPDIISEHIGSEPTLPYLSQELAGEKLLVGANFASAGVGILNDTGSQFVNILRMPLQLEYFKEYQQRLGLEIGEKQAKELVNKALVLISLGGNDFVNNYFLYPFSPRSQQAQLPEFVTNLLTEYRKMLEKLYEMGARRVIVLGSGPLGCAPAERSLHSLTGECVSKLQEAASLFEPQLTKMVQDLNEQYHAEVFLAANTKLMHHDMISDPKAFGFKTSKIACCGQGPFNGWGFCRMDSNLCQNRDEYVFWDAFHPSERASRIIVQQIMHGTNDYMKPMNLSVLMAVDSKQ